MDTESRETMDAEKNCNEFELPRHFVMHCSSFNNEHLALYMQIQEGVDKDSFNMLIQYPEHDFIYFLGQHDNIYNTVFLEFLSNAC